MDPGARAEKVAHRAPDRRLTVELHLQHEGSCDLRINVRGQIDRQGANGRFAGGQVDGRLGLGRDPRVDQRPLALGRARRVQQGLAHPLHYRPRGLKVLQRERANRRIRRVLAIRQDVEERRLIECDLTTLGVGDRKERHGRRQRFVSQRRGNQRRAVEQIEHVAFEGRLVAAVEVDANLRVDRRLAAAGDPLVGHPRADDRTRRVMVHDDPLLASVVLFDADEVLGVVLVGEPAVGFVRCFREADRSCSAASAGNPAPGSVPPHRDRSSRSTTTRWKPARRHVPR